MKPAHRTSLIPGAILTAAVLLGGMLLFTMAFVLPACGHGATACKVIDAANEACAVIRYLGPDGKVYSVQVSNEELASFGQRTAAKRAGSDAGAPAPEAGAK